MKVKINEAIAMAKEGKSLQNVVVEDLQDVQVKAMDALLLARNGIAIPEQNIYYDDNDIAYDEEFDEVEWSKEPIQMTFEEKVELANQIAKNGDDEEILLKIQISDEEVKEWVKINSERVGKILGGLIVDLYRTQKIIKE